MQNAIQGTRGRRVGIPLPMANCAYVTITSNNIIEMEGNHTFFEGEQTFHTADGSPAMLFTNSPFNDDHVQRFNRCDNHERNGFPILMDDGFLSPVVSKGVKWAIDEKATPENHHNTTTTSGFDSKRVSMSVKSHGGETDDNIITPTISFAEKIEYKIEVKGAARTVVQQYLMWFPGRSESSLIKAF